MALLGSTPVYLTLSIQVCLGYEGLEWPGGGNMSMVGPKNDLLLFLNHVQCRLPGTGGGIDALIRRAPFRPDRHQNEHREFLIFTDFDMDFEDHTGYTGRIRGIRATRDNIVRHDTLNTKHEADTPRLSGKSHSGYDARSGEGREVCPLLSFVHGFVYQGFPLRLSSNPFAKIEISSTAKDQFSFSEKYEKSEKDAGTTHGILTWNLFEYLKGGWSWALGSGDVAKVT
ncbi:hypothetical protein FRC00_000957 [Tulasnella sp. 408]|nr:hypothetical protein FRC00_000957 [Tulasnella sp. 408]